MPRYEIKYYIVYIYILIHEESVWYNHLGHLWIFTFIKVIINHLYYDQIKTILLLRKY